MKWWFIQRSLPFILNIHNESFEVGDNSGKIILNLPPMKLPGQVYSLAEFRIPMVGKYLNGNVPFSDFEEHVKLLNKIIRLYLKETADVFNNGIIQEFNDINDFFEFVHQGVYDDVAEQYSNIGQSQLIKKIAYGSHQNVAQKIKKLLNENQDLSVEEELLIRANAYFHASNYKMSVIESAILIEILITKEVINFFGNVSKSQKGDLDDFIQRVGLKNLLSLFLPKIRPKIPKKLIDKCKSCISCRNKIMHKAWLKVIQNQAQEAVETAGQFYKLLNQ